MTYQDKITSQDLERRCLSAPTIDSDPLPEHEIHDPHPRGHTPPAFTCTLIFQDSNMPKMHQNEKTETHARATISHWSRQFAGVKLLKIIDNATGAAHVFNSAGTYLFTCPKIGG